MISKNESDMLALLRNFYYIAKEGSVSKAATHVGLTQSSLSLQLQRLERLVNATLFRRSRSNMELTPAGQLLYEKSISIFEEVRTLRQGLLPLLPAESMVRVAAIDALAFPFLSNCISKFQKQCPEAAFTVSSHAPSVVCQLVQEAEVDMALVRQNSCLEGMIFKPLFSTRLVLLAHPRFEEQICKPCPLPAELSALPYVGFNPDNEFFTYIQQNMATHGVHLNVVHDHVQVSTILQYVKSGIGVAILDDVFIPSKENLLAYPLDTYFPKNTFGVLLRSIKHLSPICQLFLEFLLANAKVVNEPKSL